LQFSGVGEVRQIGDAEGAEHNAAYTRGWKLATRHLILAGPQRIRKPPGWFARRRLKKAIVCFQRALSIAPENWPSLWVLGKIYQRLGQLDEALKYFRHAFALDPTHPGVAREAGGAALAVGNGAEAIRYCEAALAASPNDHGLVANLALAYLISGQTDTALQKAREAVDRDPKDEISKLVLRWANDVNAGKRPAPRTLGEVR
jgi:tetratricopeptide (TPR) repeat protein